MHSDSGSPLPPDVREWIDKTAAQLRNALDDPAVRREIIGLLSGEDERRQRRLAEIAQDLDGMEITLKLGRNSNDG